MAIVPLSGRVRPARGKGPARQARRDGLIPGVMYGHGESPVALAVQKREFELAMKTARGSNVIVGLTLDGGAQQTAIIREVQRDPINHDILHLDFHHISLTEKVKVEVTVHLVGTADGVRNFGGVLDQQLYHLTVRCFPADIPESIDLDVTPLGIGQSIHVRDVQVAKGTILNDGGQTVCVVSAPRVEESPAGEAASAEPELIRKPKAEEAE